MPAPYGVFRQGLLVDRLDVRVSYALNNRAERRGVASGAQFSDKLLERHDTQRDAHRHACRDAHKR